MLKDHAWKNIPMMALLFEKAGAEHHLGWKVNSCGSEQYEAASNANESLGANVSLGAVHVHAFAAKGRT